MRSVTVDAVLTRSKRFASLVGCAILAGAFIAPVVDVVVPSSASALGCVAPQSGAWSGLWASTFPPPGPGYEGAWYGSLSFKRATTPGDYTVSGSIHVIGSAVTIGGPAKGSLNCGVLQFGVVSGPVNVTFDGNLDASGATAQGTFSEVDGSLSDIGTWTGGHLAITVTPGSGGAGTSVTVASANGVFRPGESVTVSYATRETSPTSVTLCTHTADFTTGAFSCNATIPNDATTGPLGNHSITAVGASSQLKTKTNYTLTW